MSAGLARVTINAPQRRVDVALPEHVPLAELLPEVLRHAGEEALPRLRPLAKSVVEAELTMAMDRLLASGSGHTPSS